VVGIWRGVHRVEEALIEILPTGHLVAGALLDHLRLEASSIPARDQLRTALRRALDLIDPGVARRLLGDTGASGPTKQRSAPDEARPVLREVRHAINEFRDGLYEDLVRARDELQRTTLVAGALDFGLLALAVAADVSSAPLVAGTAFFLVGALTGLFARLSNPRSTKSVVDDFGLFEARAVAGTLMAGLAAIAGVLVLATFEAAAISLLPTSAVDPGTTRGSAVDVEFVFDLSKNPLGLLVAAEFGLVPRQMTDALMRHADDLKRQISSSQLSGTADDRRRP
jgi:hypothetical protein